MVGFFVPPTQIQAPLSLPENYGARCFLIHQTGVPDNDSKKIMGHNPGENESNQYEQKTSL
jgi:hypothetical protein